MKYDSDPNAISDNVLMQLQRDIDEELEDKSLERKDKVTLEVLGYFLIFLRSDHHKINEMYPYFIQEKKSKAQKNEDERWMRRTIFGTAIAAIVMLLINGWIFLVSTVPLIRNLMELSKP